MNYFKTSKATYESISKTTTSAPVITENSKKSIRMNVKLESNSEHLITGIRFKVDLTPLKPSSAALSFKVFNRIVKLKTPPKVGPSSAVAANMMIWFDIGFCDAEILFSSVNNNSIETEFLTDDPKNMPLKIFSIEVYGQSKKEFGFREKMRKLERLATDKLNSEKGPEI